MDSTMPEKAQLMREQFAPTIALALGSLPFE
jgi:hypothetical protein